ncbi:leukocyte elastase inhibitor-like [Schistocerca nitens]|uniref:leukocyte elastase inhibitor-like n=1 Tax=Schistocerca nitens TaxID=7011 RepID=UPI002119534A|nr:leukocyte elastase inhibitor-like [Schistocerca nitens]
MKLYVCMLLLGLVCAHPALELSRGRKEGFDSDKISFPEDISSPFVEKQEIVADHYKNAVKALFEVVIRLKRVVAGAEERGGNFIVSPLSVAVALGQILLGARGDTRRRLASILTPLAGTRLDEPLHRELGALLRLLQEAPRRHDFALDVAAAFFLQDGLPVRDSYRYSVNRLYGTDLLRLDFARDPVGAQRRVNGWVSEHTRGHIDSILSHPLPPTTAAVLANCIYFNGRWEQPFDPDVSIEAPFHLNSTSTIPVTLMRNTIEAMYANSSTFSLVALPYRHQQAAMYLVLPHDKHKDIGQFMSELSLQELHRVIESVTLHVVNLVMPRMSLSTVFSLRGPLARLQKRKVPNEENEYEKTLENVVTLQGKEQNSSCNSSHLECERIVDSEHVNESNIVTQTVTHGNGTDVLRMSALDDTSSDEYRLARLSGTERQYFKGNNNQSSAETAAALTDFYKPYINSASVPSNGKKPGDLSLKWTRTQNKTTVSKPGSTAPDPNFKPTTRQSSPATTTETSNTGSPRPPNELVLDVTGASDDPRFRIDDIIHQSWLEVTETGTEAAAATVSAIDYSGDSVVFLVNRPFLFFIRHEVTLAPIFWGVITDPTSASSSLSAP